MSTAEMTMTTNTARALIDARLETVERALFGRISRAERMDIVGEVESRIDELLRERCGPGGEPTREDVLAVLARLDPPEAYLDFESGEGVRQPAFERFYRIERDAMSPEVEQLRKRALAGGICGIVALVSSLMAALLFFAAVQLDLEILFFGGSSCCALLSIAFSIAAFVFAGFSRMITGWSLVAVVLGAIAITITMMQFVIFALGV